VEEPVAAVAATPTLLAVVEGLDALAWPAELDGAALDAVPAALLAGVPFAALLAATVDAGAPAALDETLLAAAGLLPVVLDPPQAATTTMAAVRTSSTVRRADRWGEARRNGGSFPA